MDKVIRDGKVAVLISPDWGTGWYSWSGIQEMLFDPKIVAMVENPDDDEDFHTIIEYCKDRYGGSDTDYLGAEGLMVVWVPQGSRFIVTEYDGAESIEFEDTRTWITP